MLILNPRNLRTVTQVSCSQCQVIGEYEPFSEAMFPTGWHQIEERINRNTARVAYVCIICWKTISWLFPETPKPQPIKNPCIWPAPEKNYGF